MDPKQLKKMADACRKAGIKHYKCSEYEFTLSDEAPVSNYKKAQKPNHGVTDKVDTDELTPEQLLFYSVQDDLGVDESLS